MLPRTLHHQRWAVGGTGNTLGHTAQQQIFLTVRTLSANHNQVALRLRAKRTIVREGRPPFTKARTRMLSAPNSMAWDLACTAISVAYSLSASSGISSLLGRTIESDASNRLWCLNTHSRYSSAPVSICRPTAFSSALMAPLEPSTGTKCD